jgi:hypothetical protein
MKMNDNTIKEKIIAFVKIFIEAWESNAQEGNKFISGYIKTIQEEIKNNPKDYPEYRKLKKNLGENWQEEIDSLIYEALADHYWKSKQWLTSNNPTLETYPSTLLLVKYHMFYKRLKQKETSKYEWLATRKQKEIEERKKSGEKNRGEMSLDNIPDNYFKENKQTSKYRRLKAGKQRIMPPPPDKKDKRLSQATEEIQKIFYPFLERIGSAPKEKIKNPVVFHEAISGLRKVIVSDYIKNFKEAEKTGKTVYRLAKENKINKNKLLYALQSIDFPFSPIKRNNENIVSGKNLVLFEKTILPLLKRMWKQKENYKKWRDYFKNELGWKKSRISNFIKRRTADKVVPQYFFDVIPPPPTEKLLSKLINKDKKLIGLFQKMENHSRKHSPHNNHLQISTHKEIKKYLKKVIGKDSKKLL